MGLPANEWEQHPNPRVRAQMARQRETEALRYGSALNAELLAAAERSLRKAPRAKRVGGFDSKLERDRYEYHMERVRGGLIAAVLRQPLFDLPGGLRYRADFELISVELFGGGREITIEEVKGHRASKNARDSITRCKIAAGLNQWARWLLVFRNSDGTWREEESW